MTIYGSSRIYELTDCAIRQHARKSRQCVNVAIRKLSVTEETIIKVALRAIQAQQEWREDVDADELKAKGALDDANIVCKVDTGRALVEAGLHPATGGDGSMVCSGDMLLEALVACAGVTMRAVATAIGVELRDARILAEGDLDFRGTLGVAKDAPVGFRDIRLRFELDSDASEDQRATLIRLTERYCVVLQTLRQPPSIAVSSRQ